MLRQAKPRQSPPSWPLRRRGAAKATEGLAICLGCEAMTAVPQSRSSLRVRGGSWRRHRSPVGTVVLPDQALVADGEFVVRAGAIDPPNKAGNARDDRCPRPAIAVQDYAFAGISSGGPDVSWAACPHTGQRTLRCGIASGILMPGVWGDGGRRGTCGQGGKDQAKDSMLHERLPRNARVMVERRATLDQLLHLEVGQQSTRGAIGTEFRHRRIGRQESRRGLVAIACQGRGR